MSLVLIFNNELPPPTSFIGSIDHVVITNSFTEDLEIKRRYEVATKNPNEYVSTLVNGQFDLLWACDQAAPKVDVYTTAVVDNVISSVPIEATMTDGFSLSDSFAITPHKNKISFVFMDSDAVPRDQYEVESDIELDGDPQLVTTNVPYRGIVTLEWDDENTKLSFDAHAVDPAFGPNNVWDLPILELYTDYKLKLNFDGEFASIDVIKDDQLQFDETSETSLSYSEEQVVFRTNKFPLDFRLRGGVGWSASLFDVNSNINYVTTENMGFAEYRSTQIKSKTPYAGVQVFPSETPPSELVGSFNESDWGGQIASDDDKSDSGVAFKVTTSGQKRFEGIRTNRFFVKTPDDIRIYFDTQSPVPLDVFLYSYGDDKIIPVRNRAMFQSKGWSSNAFDVTSPSGAGYYSLYITSSSNGIWYVDNVSVTVPSVSWSARSRALDAWIPFKNVSGTEYGGVMFDNRGVDLQIRALSRFENATINSVQIQPKYAELGNIVWPDEVNNA